ncbi:hypothetical protein PSAB6_370039 [Paraburkholderia sabiae]|nr:hypothetical protein PSAB6_370039 [Paraburkholderia sabiae]
MRAVRHTLSLYALTDAAGFESQECCGFGFYFISDPIQ